MNPNQTNIPMRFADSELAQHRHICDSFRNPDKERQLFGSTSDDHLTHGIQNVSAIRVLPRAGRSGAAVLIEARDSIQTLLELTCPEDYALPPAPKEFKKVY
jgi:hypothetical protein